ncbi:hypothetical protein [Flagellimonas sp.]|uniref:hypothetical protein n=1 Tax=Flagellimonas sp. TaxID=2058762 RepID=UPI003F4A0F29
MKIPFALLFAILLSTNAHTQVEELDPNKSYEDFSLAYRTLDAEHLTHTYTANAALLNLYDTRDPNSILGAENIKEYFAGFFKRFKEGNQSLTLTFKIIDRQNRDGVIYDNGYYKLTISAPDTSDRVSHGKLSTVLVQDSGRWKFKIDSNTNTAQEEYENAKAGSMPQPK